MNAITRSLSLYWNSSIGKKLIVALTGLFLVLFLLGHLSGNLLMYLGEEAFNEYAALLHGALHGAGIWIARVLLLGAFALHIAATIALTRQNRAARQPYAHEATIQASRSSRYMIASGLTVLAFVIFHILHFTVRVDAELAGLADAGNPYGMVILGFQSWWVSLFYIIAIVLLCSHLSHGIGSIFQTLGLRSRKARDVIHKFSLGLSILLGVGFISIPLAVLFGFLKA